MSDSLKNFASIAAASMIGSMIAERWGGRSRREHVVEAWAMAATRELCQKLDLHDDEWIGLTRSEKVELEREIVDGTLAAIGTVLSARPKMPELPDGPESPAEASS